MQKAALTHFLDAVRSDRLAALATLLGGDNLGSHLYISALGERAGSLGSAELDNAALPHLQDALGRQAPFRGTLMMGAQQVELFIDISAPPARLIVIGAVHTAIPLVTFANVLGFRTILVDNRSAFATRERFGHATEIIQRWPADALADLAIGPADCLVFLSHDAKLDNPALAFALTTPARYIGALGSRKTHEKRLVALRELGCDVDSLARIHAPIGLDLGGRTPEEIALAIMAEVIEIKNLSWA